MDVVFLDLRIPSDSIPHSISAAELGKCGLDDQGVKGMGTG